MQYVARFGKKDCALKVDELYVRAFITWGITFHFILAELLHRKFSIPPKVFPISNIENIVVCQAHPVFSVLYKF